MNRRFGARSAMPQNRNPQPQCLCGFFDRRFIMVETQLLRVQQGATIELPYSMDEGIKFKIEVQLVQPGTFADRPPYLV
jgi:hypothetical protein